MYQYFAFNILISLMVFAYLYALKTAPHKIRFRFVMLGLLFWLLSWLLPYDLIDNYFSQNSAVVFSTVISELNSSIKQAIITNIKAETFVTLLNSIKVMTFIGLILFIKDLVSLRVKITCLNKQATLHKTIDGINIYTIKSNDIFTAGISNPKIYLGEEHLSSAYVKSIIQHELQHIKQHDQYWLLFITFVQRILWWNPIVYLLACKGRDLIELRCDQACKAQSKNNQYQQNLAQILLSQNNQVSNHLISHFFGKNNLNIFRIKQLSQEYNMNKKHKALIFSTAIIPFILAVFVSTSSISSEQKIIESIDDEIVLGQDEVDLTIKVTLTKLTETHVETGEVIELNTQTIEARM
ncbi:MAG: M56 family metallopeptidase, partial [Proteobacteria bacterium]|nr:M56 family metallopeptidase [Pseudomonadota bacterium]